MLQLLYEIGAQWGSTRGKSRTGQEEREVATKHQHLCETTPYPYSSTYRLMYNSIIERPQKEYAETPWS